MKKRNAIIFLFFFCLFLTSFICTWLILISKGDKQSEKSVVVVTNPPVKKDVIKNTDKPAAIPKDSIEPNKENPPIVNQPKENPPKADEASEKPAKEPQSPVVDGKLKEYETKFEDIYKKDGIKTAFLTFDDGPSKKVTPQVLDILKEYDIKATFFVVGNQVQNNQAILKRTYEEGHSIALHSYSHNYGEIYSNIEAFSKDFKKVEQLVNNILGKNFSTRIYRFPGGSFGSKKDSFKKYINDIGCHYIDWNTLTGDTEYIVDSKGKKVVRSEPKALISRFKETLKASGNKEDIVVLMHDLGTKQSTADALPELIEFLKREGYAFKTIK